MFIGVYMTKSEVRNQLKLYLDGDMSLHDFHLWLTIEIDYMPQRTKKYAYSIMLRLYEYSSGHWHIKGLNEELRKLCQKPKAS